jgi:hypothetical protein
MRIEEPDVRAKFGKGRWGAERGFEEPNVKRNRLEACSTSLEQRCPESLLDGLGFLFKIFYQLKSNTTVLI